MTSHEIIHGKYINNKRGSDAMKPFFMSISFIAFIGFTFLIGLGFREEDLFKCLVELTLGFGGLVELFILVLMYRNYEAIAQAAAIDDTPKPRASKYDDARLDSSDNKSTITTETWEEKYQRELRRSREIDRWMREEDAEQERITQRKEDWYSTW